MYTCASCTLPLLPEGGGDLPRTSHAGPGVL